MCAMPRGFKEGETHAAPQAEEGAEEIVDPDALSLPETMRLFEPVSEMMGRANWDRLPQIFAVGLVVHRLLEKNAELICTEAQAILRRSRKKI